MKNGQPSENAIRHASTYVDSRLAGANKHDSAIVANYSESTANKPSLIEQTKAYGIVVTETLNNNSTALRQVVRFINEDVYTDMFQALPTSTKVDIAYKMAKIHDILTPKVTIKETTDKDGNKTRTAWGSGSLQQGETPQHDPESTPWGNA